MTTLKIQTRGIHTLNPYENNAKEHPPEQIDQIAASIEKFGFNDPIAVDGDNVIIEGHGRLLAAQQLGMKEVPVIELSHLSEAEKKAYIITHNKLTMNTGFDEEILAEEIAWLSEQDFDLELTGFTTDELEDLISDGDSGEGLTDEDSVPEVSEDIITKEGDIWLLGDHRLMCGDSTNAESVALLLNGEQPNLMVTDPPYGVNYDPEWREGCDLGVGKRSKGKVKNDDRADWTKAWELFKGNVAYVWHASSFSHVVAQNLIDCDFEIKSIIIWAKQHFTLGRSDYHWKHEPCFYVVRKGKTHAWKGGRKQTTIWEIANNNAFGGESEETFGHGTQKPLECMERPIRNNSSSGEYVYDPFGGSGTTIIACEKTNRKCFMMEIDPHYVSVIIERWQAYTGKKAIREDGVKYNDLKKGDADVAA